MQRPHIATRMPSWFPQHVQRLFTVADLVAIIECIAACGDPAADKFLELAVRGSADLTVSGDADLLVVNPFQDIPVVASATFMRAAAGI